MHIAGTWWVANWMPPIFNMEGEYYPPEKYLFQAMQNNSSLK